MASLRPRKGQNYSEKKESDCQGKSSRHRAIADSRDEMKMTESAKKKKWEEGGNRRQTEGRPAREVLLFLSGWFMLRGL